MFHFDLCFCESYNITVFDYIITYYIILMFWKWSKIMNQNCNRIISIEFLFIVENKLFWSRRSYPSLYSYSSLFTFTADFLKSPIQKKNIISFYPTRHCLYFAWFKWFLLSQAKSVIPCSILNPWILWTVDPHTNVKGKSVRLIDIELILSLLES